MLSEPFRRVEEEYYRLKGEFNASDLTVEQLVAALDKLMFVHEGRYWMIGADSGKWYVHDGRDWVESAPPGLPPLDELDTPGAGGGLGGAAGPGASPRAGAPAARTEETDEASDLLLDPEVQAGVRERTAETVERGSARVDRGDPAGAGAAPDAASLVAPHVQFGELRRLEGHAGRVRGVAFLPDGARAVTAGEDGTARLWELAGGWVIRRFEVRSPAAIRTLECVAVSPDGRLALLGGYGSLVLGEVESGREVRRFEGHERAVNSVAFSQNGRYALSGGSDNTLRLWEVESGREVRRFTGHTERVHGVALSPDARLALSPSWDQTLRLWDVVEGREIRQIQNEFAQFTSAAFLPDGRHAVSDDCDDNGPFASLWDLSTGERVRAFQGHAALVNSLAVSRDGRRLLTGSGVDAGTTVDLPLDNTVRLWEVASGRELCRLEGHTGEVSSVALSPDGRLALSASSDNTVRLWELPE